MARVKDMSEAQKAIIDELWEAEKKLRDWILSQLAILKITG